MRTRKDFRRLFAALLLSCQITAGAGSAGISHAALPDGEELTIHWSFDDSDRVPLETLGKVTRSQPGPRPPEFPLHAAADSAVWFDGQGARLVVNDEPTLEQLAFRNGDEMTIETWAKIDGTKSAGPMYIIGKGRTGNPNFARDNQNWSLRLTSENGITKVGFLFATAPGAGTEHWHRWTSQAGFKPDTGWHHVALAYRFGHADSIRAWIDGLPITGHWDLGGPTAAAPVVDADEVWIGSSQGGNPGNSLRGWLDSVTVHRRVLPAKLIASRFDRVGGPQVQMPIPAKMPALGAIPPGRVLVSVAEGLPAETRWLNVGESWPTETTRWLGDEFIIPRIPLRYDEWGIRSSWKVPLLVRIAADIELPAGDRVFLLRARSLSRLWVDGKLVASTTAITKQPPNGEEPITPLAVPPLPGIRVHGYHQQEVVTRVSSDARALPGNAALPGNEARANRPVRVVLEMIVGGKNLRPETGEVCVAIQTADGQLFHVLQPHTVSKPRTPLPLTSAAIEPALARIESSLQEFDDQTRRQAAATQDEFWQRRHDLAREWAAEHTLPEDKLVSASGHSIDQFIDRKIQSLRQTQTTTNHDEAAEFHTNILPILREKCFRCHGDKGLGGLRLNSRSAMLAGGDSGEAAIIAGEPDASELMRRIRSDEEGTRMPPEGDALSASQIAIIGGWIKSGASWPAAPLTETQLQQTEVVEDAPFARRVYLDTVGVPPTSVELERFLADERPDRRGRLIDQLLEDERGADHAISFWLDILAENPTLLNASLNSTGPFRWFLYDSLRDHKSLDRMATELILMRGDPHSGGSAGFALAGENDAPLAAKGHIIASTFLGIELQCARCHDSPYHSTTQSDLYSLAAMLDRKAVTVPKTSRVPDAFFENKSRESLIQVSLPLGQSISPQWPFADVTGVEDTPAIDQLMLDPEDSRERLAALTTAPENHRFARVLVNQIWLRLIGGGLVEPSHDWENAIPSHPALLDWLALELMTHDYDARHVQRLILTSQTYQRVASGHNRSVPAEQRLFNAPDRRRLTAEQIVDSLAVATGASWDVEELTFVHDGRRALSNRLTLGRPTRAWMFASLNNERDRPSLSLPAARAVTDVLKAFGWTGSRQRPISQREIEANPRQSGILANGTLTNSMSRAAYQSELARLAVDAKSPEQLLNVLFARFLSRTPTATELQFFREALQTGFATRIRLAEDVAPPSPAEALPLVTWFNHQRPGATTIQKEVERRVRQGPPVDPRLQSEWREVYEDFVWSLINHREFVWIP